VTFAEPLCQADGREKAGSYPADQTEKRQCLFSTVSMARLIVSNHMTKEKKFASAVDFSVRDDYRTIQRARLCAGSHQEEENNEIHLFGIHELTHMRWSRTASFWVSAERTIRCRHSACPATFSPSAPRGSRCRLIRFGYGQEPVLVPFWEARRSLLRWHEPRFTRSLSTVFLWLRTNSWKMRSHSPEFLFEMGSGC
jgi:hypothetical protein